MRLWVLAAVCLIAACARRNDRFEAGDLPGRTMPNPDGCYLLVWEQAQFLGASEYINGPRDYPNLRSLPNNRSWRNRIASVRVGPTADAMAFTDENFSGPSLRLAAGSNHSALPDGLIEEIESLRVGCKAPAVTTR